MKVYVRRQKVYGGWTLLEIKDSLLHYFVDEEPDPNDPNISRIVVGNGLGIEFVDGVKTLLWPDSSSRGLLITWPQGAPPFEWAD